MRVHVSYSATLDADAIAAFRRYLGRSGDALSDHLADILRHTLQRIGETGLDLQIEEGRRLLAEDTPP